MLLCPALALKRLSAVKPISASELTRQYVRVPYGDVNTLPIPKQLCDEDVLFLSDVLPTSYHCVVDTGVEDGDVVAVWGLGPIGLCALKWAKIKGASVCRVGRADSLRRQARHRHRPRAGPSREGARALRRRDHQL